MMRRSSLLAAAAVLVLGGAGCRTTTMPDDADAGGGPDTIVQDMVTSDMPGGDTQPGDAGDATMGDTTMGDGGTRNVTIRQLQDLADPMHPAPGTQVTLSQSGMVALTPRVLIGSASGDSMMRCRFAAWVGDGMGGDFSGIEVQELIPLGTATSCFNTMARRIPADLAPGDRISVVQNCDYGEFCAAAGADAGTCRDLSQSNLFGPSVFTRTGTGPAPTPTTITVADLVAGTDGRPGPRALALEGVFVRINNASVRAVATGDGGAFTDVFVSDQSDTGRAHEIDVLISNFTGTTCARNYFRAQNGMVVSFVQGILVPDFGRWKLRMRDQNDVGGIMCATDGGVDGGADAATDATMGGG